MGGSGGSLGSYISGAGNVEEALQRIRHGALESSVNLLLQQEGIGVAPNDEEVDDPRLEAIRVALLNGIGEVRLQPLGGLAENTGSNDILAVFAVASIAESPPGDVINRMVVILQDLIPREGDIEMVDRESFGVIVRYMDGVVYRLTPAITTNDRLSIPSSDSSSWVPLGNR